MRSRRSRLAVLAAGLLLFSSPVLTHHSQSQYDKTRKLTLAGTVSKFSFTNPHTWIGLDVKNAKGKVETWSIETQSAVNLRRAGWKSSDVKVGDQVTAIAWPMRGAPLQAMLSTITLADGRTHVADPGDGLAKPSGYTQK